MPAIFATSQGSSANSLSEVIHSVTIVRSRYGACFQCSGGNVDSFLQRTESLSLNILAIPPSRGYKSHMPPAQASTRDSPIVTIPLLPEFDRTQGANGIYGSISCILQG